MVECQGTSGAEIPEIRVDRVGLESRALAVVGSPGLAGEQTALALKLPQGRLAGSQGMLAGNHFAVQPAENRAGAGPGREQRPEIVGILVLVDRLLGLAGLERPELEVGRVAELEPAELEPAARRLLVSGLDLGPPVVVAVVDRRSELE